MNNCKFVRVLSSQAYPKLVLFIVIEFCVVRLISCNTWIKGSPLDPPTLVLHESCGGAECIKGPNFPISPDKTGSEMYSHFHACNAR